MNGQSPKFSGKFPVIQKQSWNNWTNENLPNSNDTHWFACTSPATPFSPRSGSPLKGTAFWAENKEDYRLRTAFLAANEKGSISSMLWFVWRWLDVRSAGIDSWVRNPDSPVRENCWTVWTLACSGGCHSHGHDRPVHRLEFEFDCQLVCGSKSFLVGVWLWSSEILIVRETV